MIQIKPNDKVFVASQAIDFRCGIDGVMGLIKNTFKIDPFSGAFFCFVNKLKTAIKILYYDGQGFWLMHKRFSEGKMKWWPISPENNGGLGSIDAKNFILLIFGGDPRFIKLKENWKEFEN
jgi:hypothetical protein